MSSSIVFPDVCKTPAPAGPIPVPYPILGNAPPNAAGSPKKVKTSNKEFAQHMENLRVAGDADAGAANGVASAVTLRQKATNFLMASFKVKAEGAIPAVLIGRGLMNHAPHGSAQAGAEVAPAQTTRLSR